MSNKKIKIKQIVHIELEKYDTIGVSDSPRKNSTSNFHKNEQFACFPFHKSISKYEG